MNLCDIIAGALCLGLLFLLWGFMLQPAASWIIAKPVPLAALGIPSTAMLSKLTLAGLVSGIITLALAYPIRKLLG